MYECPADLPEKGDTKTCTSCRERYPDRPFQDMWTGECYAECPEVTLNGGCDSCRDMYAERPFWNASARVCQSCAEAFPDRPIWNPNTLSCVSECPRATPVKQSEPYRCDYCVEAASRTGPRWDGEKCAPCPADAPNWDGVNMKCMPPCPREAPFWGGPFYDYKMCLSGATFGKSPALWNPNTNLTTDACPTDTPQIRGTETCYTCREKDPGAPFWNAPTEECVSACPETASGDACRTCSEVDSTAPFWDADAKMCRRCADARPETPLWDPNVQGCVAKCSWPRYNDPSTCLPCSAQNAFFNGSVCV